MKESCMTVSGVTICRATLKNHLTTHINSKYELLCNEITCK